MEILRSDLQCMACQKKFPVELARMRFNFQHACPFCGAVYTISEQEALKAHRALDEMEHMRKCAGCVSGRSSTRSVSARFLKCSCFSTFSAVIGNDLCEAV